MTRRMTPFPGAYTTAAADEFYSKNLDLLTHWSQLLSVRTIEEMEISGMQLGSGYFMLALLHIADEDAKNAPQHLGRLSGEAIPMLREVLGSQALCHVGAVGGDLAALFCFPRCREAEELETEPVEAACREFVQAFRQAEPEARFSLLLGEPVLGYGAISEAYARILDHLKYMQFMGQVPYFSSGAPADCGADPQVADYEKMTSHAESMAGAIGKRSVKDIADHEARVLKLLFSGDPQSLRPVHFRLYSFLGALLKALESRSIVDRRFTGRQDFFKALTSAPSYHAFCEVFHRMIISVLQQYDRDEAAASVAARLQQARDYCDKNFRRRELTVSGLAERCNMSQPQFSAAFKRQFGMNPLAYLNGLRLSAAKALLKSTEQTQAEIAGLCGFSSALTMQRLFAKEEHCTPGQYRASWP